MNVDAARHEGQAENTEPSRNATETREPSVGLEMLLRVPDLNRVGLAETVQRGPANTSRSESAAPNTAVAVAQAETPQPDVSKNSSFAQPTTNHSPPAAETRDEPAAVTETAQPDRRFAWKSHWNAVGTAATALPGKVQALARKVRLPARLGRTASSGGTQAAQAAKPQRATSWNPHWKMLGALAAAILLCTFVARAMRRERPVDSAPQQLAQQAVGGTTRQLPPASPQTSSTSGVTAVATEQGHQAGSANFAPASPSVDVAQRGPSAFTGARRIGFESSQPTNSTHVPTSHLHAPSQSGYDPGPARAPSQSNFASRNMEAASFQAERAAQQGSAYAEATEHAPPGSQVSGGFGHDMTSQYNASGVSSVPQGYGGNSRHLDNHAHPTGRAAAGEFVDREPSGQVPQGPTQWSRDGDTFGGRPELQLNRPGTLPRPPGPAVDGRSPVGAPQFPSGRVHVDAGAPRGQSSYPATNPATYMYRPGDFDQIRTSLLTDSGHAQSGFPNNQPRNSDDRNLYPGNRPVTQQRATVPSSSGVYR